MRLSPAHYILKVVSKNFNKLFPQAELFKNKDIDLSPVESLLHNSKSGEYVKLYKPYHLSNVTIGKFTYIAPNANISMSSIGAFCSIGPNLLCGWGIHPMHGISTHPMFYSSLKQNGMSLANTDKFIEREKIEIGNDVFIGANVTILDGISIGNGAAIGAGAVVSKDIPPYAIAVGSPIHILKYRHPPEIIEKLNKIKWWDWEFNKLSEVEKYFDDTEGFINRFS
jgi:virginiamycin A acetyltransferase